MKKKKNISQIILNLIFIIACIVTIFPLVLLISVSFSNEMDIALNGYSILPKTMDLSAYKYVLRNPETILQAYKVTATFSIIKMGLGVMLMAMIAYPLSIKAFRARRGVSFFLYFTMLFSGGMVPTYILITQYLQLNNNIWVYIIPGLISPWYVFMMRTFMQSIPEQLREAVKIDGGNEYTIFFRIILPLSKPVLATVALFTFLAAWNDWNTPMLYITDNKLNSLQYLLQILLKDLEVLKQMQASGLSLEGAVDVPSETVRMAMAVLVMGPILIVFPFFQKYFVKGMTVGSVKG